MENENTTIQIRKTTRERLGSVGTKNDRSLDDVLNKLLDCYEEYQMNQIIKEKGEK